MNNFIDIHEQFWEGFSSYLSSHQSPLRPLEPKPACNVYNLLGNESYYGVHFAEYNENRLWLIGLINPSDGEIAVKIQLDSELYNRLSGDNDARKVVQNHLGDHVNWNKSPSLSIGMYKRPVDLRDNHNHEELFEWLNGNLIKLEKVFQELISYCIKITNIKMKTSIPIINDDIDKEIRSLAKKTTQGKNEEDIRKIFERKLRDWFNVDIISVEPKPPNSYKLWVCGIPNRTKTDINVCIDLSIKIDLSTKK